MNYKSVFIWIGSIVFLYGVFPYIYTNLWYSQIVDGAVIEQYFPIKSTFHPSILNPPVQTMINRDGMSFKFGQYTVTPVATFQLQAIVLSSTRYYLNIKNYMDTKMDAALFPMDLALGWQIWDDPHFREQVDVSQAGRFYFWHTDHYVASTKQINDTASNMHIIPANRKIFNKIYSFREGELVTLSGYLVNASNESGLVWHTSLTREDSGGGACEIFLVEEAEGN
jgi:hypothetical protein